MKFALDAIAWHKGSVDYQTALDAQLYYAHQNPTIMRYEKFVYNRIGQKVPNTWSANHKIASHWFNYFVTQAVSFLLGNGVTLAEQTKKKLGADFDTQLYHLATYAKVDKAAFGFWNYDHVDIFRFTEFVPLYDEEDGRLKAGVRFWQIDSDRPLRITLYEPDGYTSYIKIDGEEIKLHEKKRSYKQIISRSKIGGETVSDGGNYAEFPIVPLYNIGNQSELVGNRATIDAYDLLISGLVNNVTDGEFLYWILTNCDGMSEDEVVQFIESLALNHVARAGTGDAGARVDAHKAEVPHEATEVAITRLTNQLYHDFMALKVEDIAAGNVTATQITAAYEPINQRTDQFETCVTAFVNQILKLAELDDTPTYSRSQMSNQGETIKNVLLAAEYLDEQYITAKILTLLGDADKVQEVMERINADTYNRYTKVTGE